MYHSTTFGRQRCTCLVGLVGVGWFRVVWHWTAALQSGAYPMVLMVDRFAYSDQVGSSALLTWRNGEIVSRELCTTFGETAYQLALNPATHFELRRRLVSLAASTIGRSTIALSYAALLAFAIFLLCHSRLN